MQIKAGYTNPFNKDQSKCAGEGNSNNTTYQFWQQDKQHKEVYSKPFAFQKFNYIHNNPVDAGLVDKAEEFVYSSTRDHHYGKNIGLLPIKFWDEQRESQPELETNKMEQGIYVVTSYKELEDIDLAK